MTGRRKLTEAGATGYGGLYEPPFERTGRPYVYDLCDAANQTLTRRDIEWAVSEGGELYLRDKPSWSAQRTAGLTQRAEVDRETWKRSQRPLRIVDHA